MVQHQPSHETVAAVELQSVNVYLLADLVIFLAEVHLQLVHVVGHALVLPGRDFKTVIPLEINAAYAVLAENHGERELMHVVEGNQPHRDSTDLARWHVELEDGVRIGAVNLVDAIVSPGNYSPAVIVELDEATDIVSQKVTLCHEHELKVVLAVNSGVVDHNIRHLAILAHRHGIEVGDVDRVSLLVCDLNLVLQGRELARVLALHNHAVVRVCHLLALSCRP